MEPRTKIDLNECPVPHPDSAIEDYFAAARALCERYYQKKLQEVRSKRFSEITVDDFWSEYQWAVYVSGFNSKVVAQKWDALKEAYECFLVTEKTWESVKDIIDHRKKFEAIQKVGNLLRTSWEPGGGVWFDDFKHEYLSCVQDIQKLPYMGPVSSHHLARNLGHDTIKPDLHLVRLAKYFRFDNPFEMCEHLSIITSERIGVVDLILFYAASTWGTVEMKDE